MIKLRDWQQEAAHKCLTWYLKKEDNRFVINAAPGTGKTICAISIAEELLKQNQVERLIVIAPMNSVVDQWAKKYKETTGKFMMQSTKLTSDEGVDICCTWASVKNFGWLPKKFVMKKKQWLYAMNIITLLLLQYGAIQQVMHLRTLNLS